MKNASPPTGVERFLNEKEIIVSKTDLSGKLTYTNRKFLDISDYEEAEVLGKQHNVIRHPDMPRAVFQFMWDQIGSGNEIFAYVINFCKNGDHYWVLAHVTPSFDSTGSISGYHSNRRAPNKQIIQDVITPLYQKLRNAEKAASSPKDGLNASMDMLTKFITDEGGDYGRWIFSL
ncbi:PAS domain-containing protein [Sneathiella glossodoripedis]|uniref:PAS domain-containing protein n=1 Tax=Sneathiella glossodoripedis TaxID=418853 RepID=UPI00046F8A2F|nr:PAS domain-containing protein [Sneathiella glossodoripedis]